MFSQLQTFVYSRCTTFLLMRAPAETDHWKYLTNEPETPNKLIINMCELMSPFFQMLKLAHIGMSLSKNKTVSIYSQQQHLWLTLISSQNSHICIKIMNKFEYFSKVLKHLLILAWEIFLCFKRFPWKDLN